MFVKDLCRKFYSSYCLVHLKPTTCNGYRVNIDNHIIPSEERVHRFRILCMNFCRCLRFLHILVALDRCLPVDLLISYTYLSPFLFLFYQDTPNWVDKIPHMRYNQKCK